MDKVYKFTKKHRRLQRIRNWLYEFADTKLMVVAAIIMLFMAILFQDLVR